MSNTRPAPSVLPDLVRRAAALLMMATCLLAAQAAWAEPIPCQQVIDSVNKKRDEKVTRTSEDEAATAEAMDAAKKCLANISRAINTISIPSVTFSVDFSGILSNMINRACQVVTTRIDQTGRVINGTVSGAANRFIGDVNSAIGLPPGTGSIVTGGAGYPGGTPGVTGGNMGGTVTAPAPVQPGVFDRLACAIRGNCP